MKMPTLFVGHGSPMLAIEENNITKNFKTIGDLIVDKFEKPKAILSVSAHWYTNGSFVQSDEEPRQVYDMYGFPKELYEVKYPAHGLINLTNRVLEVDNNISINDEWGIDHGSWSVLKHMFPKADIPVVQLSVNANLSAAESYEMGKKLAVLRDEGYLIFGSGNIVHNLYEVQWENENGTKSADEFDEFIKESALKRDNEKILNYKLDKNARYAVPTPDHFLPFLYILGASDEIPFVFNDVRNLGSISMTSYLFGV